MNKVVLFGRFCADVELEETRGGKKYATGRFSVRRDYVTAEGAKTDVFKIVQWGNNQAVELYHNGKKNTSAILYGRIELNVTETDEGRYSTPWVVLERVEYT